MTFTFLHTADWQIGKSFAGFEPDQASILKHARLTVIDRLAAAARGGGARHAVVCGDVFDSPGLPEKLLREVMARLLAHGDLTWHMLPGNHDPAREDGIWRRLTAVGIPANVNVLLAAAPKEIEPGVVLLPAPLSARSVSTDPSAWMDHAPATAGTIRIGVAHGSTQGFGSAGTASVGIDPARRRSAKLDYLALGDWHGLREVAAGVWYCGTPEPDQFPDNEPGFALLVSIDRAGAEPRVTPVATALYTWVKRQVVVERVADLDPLMTELSALGAAQSNTLLELTLSGAVSLAEDAALATRLDALAPALFHLRLRREGLTLRSEHADLDGLRDAQLARVGARLEALRATGSEARIAEGALRRLYALAHAAGERRT